MLKQINIGTVSRATLWRLLRDGAERVWAFPSATVPSRVETETVCVHACERSVSFWVAMCGPIYI